MILYGFNSKNSCDGWEPGMLSYVSDSYEESLSKEQEMYEKYIDLINKKIEKYQVQIETNKIMILNNIEWFQIPLLKKVLRKRKLERLLN